MKYLKLPSEQSRILPFYLAMEEYAARIIGDDDIFFMWQVKPTVIFGRNQLIDNEVNLDYCRSHGIQYYRRKSGGGCVYADMDNIMFSYITRSDEVQLTYGAYTHAVVAMLRSLGLNASDNSRNDITIDGLKVSGNAFYHLPGRSIVHGTMLFDTNMDNMLNAITPSRAKLESKGVDSVRNHITTLSRYLDIDIEQFKDYARRTLCDGEIHLNKHDVSEIEQIMQSYLTPEFILGSNPRCNVRRHVRLEGVGEFEVSMELNHNVIQRLNIGGDFFQTGDLDSGLLSRMQGVPLTKPDVEHALEGVDVGQVIMNLSNQQFIHLLFD